MVLISLRKRSHADDGAQLRVEHLDGDLAAVLQVFGEIDRGHAALAELALEAVAVAERGGEAGIDHRHGVATAPPRSFATRAGRFWITMIRVEGLLRTITKVFPSGDTS